MDDNLLKDLLAEEEVLPPKHKPSAEGADCTNCPLVAKPIAPTQGPTNSDVILVSRSPGFHEAMAGKPFSGPSGDVLNHLLKLNGRKRSDIRVTNVVLCAPDQGKVPPAAIQCCAGRLKRELKSASLVIAAGSEAVGEIIGRGAIERYRGYRIERGDTTYVATNNPALVLRDDSTFPNLTKDFKRAFNPMPTPVMPKVRLLRDEKAIVDYLASLAKRDHNDRPIAADIETRGGLHHIVELVSIQFSDTGNEAVVLGEPGIRTPKALNALETLFTRSNKKFVYHNGKFDVKALRASYGIGATLDHDTLLLSYALDERSGGDDMVGVHGLGYLLMEEFGWHKYETPDVIAFKKDGIVRDWDEFSTYAGYDVAGTMQLFNHFYPSVSSDPDLHRSYRSKLIAGAEVTMKMELHGMVYDCEAAADILENEIAPEMEAIKKRLREISGALLLNPNSPTQIAALFYDEWKVNHVMQQRPDKKRSVDDSAREELLAGRYTITTTTGRDATDVDRIRSTVEAFVKEYDRWQKLSKQASTYLTKMIERAEKDAEHRVYTELLLHGTNSGRLSSRKPNLQNITRTKEGLPDIRRLFRASNGRKIVQADYSQAELRVMACLSGDKELTRVYTDDLDLHAIAAERFYGKDFTPEERSKAKNMNFGVGYRQSAATFQEKHGIPEHEAQEFITWWWGNFSGVADWEKQIEVDIRTKGVLTSPFGRKRRFYLLTKENIQASYREGINFYPQSTASDLTLSSAIEVDKNIDPKRANLCLTVHDSILADVDEDYIDTYRSICTEIMESRALVELGWTLPFKADTGVGATWAEAK